jgi:hypothetical protein
VFVLRMGLRGRLLKEVKGFTRTCNFMFCTCVKLGVTLPREINEGTNITYGVKKEDLTDVWITLRIKKA